MFVIIRFLHDSLVLGLASQLSFTPPSIGRVFDGYPGQIFKYFRMNIDVCSVSAFFKVNYVLTKKKYLSI